MSRPPALGFALLALSGVVMLAGPAAGQEVEEAADGPAAEAATDGGVHTVRPGDTLWDLAARFLSDPYQWRDIFELNPSVVEDPHWIYPGERLRLPGAGVTRVDAVQVETADDYLRNFDRERGRYPANSVFRQSRDEGSGLSALLLDEAPPRAAVTRDDFHRAPLLVPVGERAMEGTTVRVLEENPLGLGLPPSARRHVEVVVALGGLAPAVGDTLKAVRRVRTEAPHGEVTVPKALLEVNRLWGDSARAFVVQLYGGYAVGDPVIEPDPYELDEAAQPAPLADGTPELTGSVLAFEVRQVLLGPGEFVFLDVGAAAGVRLGDEFAVHSREERGSIGSGPEDALAILRVVHVTPETSTARVTSVRDAGMRSGDPIRLIRRLATPENGPAD